MLLYVVYNLALLFLIGLLGMLMYYCKNYEEFLFYVNMGINYVKLKTREVLSYHLEIGYIRYENGYYHLVYYDGSRKYRLVFPKQKRTIVDARSEEDATITAEKIMEYMGPGNNFYGIPTTPKMLGIYKNMTISYWNPKEKCVVDKEYSPDDIISVS